MLVYEKLVLFLKMSFKFLYNVRVRMYARAARVCVEYLWRDFIVHPSLKKEVTSLKKCCVNFLFHITVCFWESQ